MIAIPSDIRGLTLSGFKPIPDEEGTERQTAESTADVSSVAASNRSPMRRGLKCDHRRRCTPIGAAALQTDPR